MITKTIDISEASSQLDELLSLALEGTEIILVKDSIPIVRLTPVVEPASKSRVAGLHQGEIWTSDNFDEPLSDDFWLGSK